MWCRTILTAVAISYVICMLLLSGLQKEDLDPSTLEKLDRHNVNIDDMNNEQQRQECLLDSYSLKGNYTKNLNLTTEVQTESFVTSATIKRNQNDVKVELHPKMGMTANFENKTVVQNEVNINKTKGFFGKLHVVAPVTLNNNDVIENFHDLGNVTKVEENKGLQIQYNIQNQPDVQSVMNFWTKLTHYTRTVVTKLPTTPAAPNISTEKNVTTTVQVESHNNGYVHSREMEYISRILAEYLASQTVTTTTQRVSLNKVYINNDVPKKYREITNMPPTDEERARLFPTKNHEQPLNDQNSDVNKINNFTREDLRSNTFIDNSMLDKSMPFKDTYDSIQQTKMIEETPYSQILKYETKTRESNSVKINNPIRLTDSLIQTNNELNNDGEPIPDTESTTKNIKFLIKKSNEQQEKGEIFNQYNILENINDVNNDNSKNVSQNRNTMMNNDKVKSASIEAETWEPVQSYRLINRQFKVIPIDEKETNQVKRFRMYDQFEAEPSNINKVERIKTLRKNTFDDASMVINKSEQIQNVNNRIKVRPPDIKKPKLYQNLDPKYDRFKTMLPSIKHSKQNKNLITNNYQPKATRAESNKLQQNDNVESYDDQLKAVSSHQTAATEKNGRNQLFKMKNEQFNRDSEIMRNNKQNSKGLHDNQFKITPAPVIKKWEQNQDSINQIKPIQESINNDERENEQLMLLDVNGLKPTQNLYEPQTIPANIIQEIAEKVKQIVLKDIEKDVTTSSTTISSTKTSSATSSTTTTSTTTATPTTITSTSTTTITTSEKPSTTLQKEMTKANHVMQKLMEIFKELKAMKETAQLTSQMPPNTTIISYGKTKPNMTIQTYPQSAASFNPYIMNTPSIFKPVQVSPYVPGMVPVPMSSGANPPQNQAAQYMPQFSMQQSYDHSGAITIQTNADEIAPLAIQISKPMKLINQHIIVTTKSSVDKLKEEQTRESKKRIEDTFRTPIEARNHREKPKLQSDFTKQVRVTDSLKRHEFSDRYSYKSRFIKDREKPWYTHEYNEKVRHIADPVVSRFPERLNYPTSVNHLEDLGQPRGLSNSERLSYTGGLKRHSFNQPVSHQNGMRYQPGSYDHSDYNRHPRYEATKFHEKLERIENWPRNTWKEFKAMSTDNSCDEISARQQMPLVKVKQRSRFDDTHFTNFLKSQQKVTDMLEKILANNIKTSGPHSVETP